MSLAYFFALSHESPSPTIMLTVWSAIVTVVDEYTPLFNGWLTNSTVLISLLGVVLGLLLVFRTNTAYDRFWEGRKVWGIVTTNVRNISRVIWIGVHSKDDANDENSRKECSINLLLAFCTATKHYLRGEQGWQFNDLAPYIAHLPEYSGSGSQSSHLDDTGSIVALNIANHLAGYVANVKDKNLIDAPTQTYLNNGIGGLVDSFTQFERIRETPIPLAYSIHLKQILYLYIVSLPFQTVVTLNWSTIPITFLTSFMLLGIEAIGREIEDPFGVDTNDLPFDEFCFKLREELAFLMKHNGEKKLRPESWLKPKSMSDYDNKKTGGPSPLPFILNLGLQRSDTPQSEITIGGDVELNNIKKT
ncbi:hypothetical protein HK096_003150 [Nowakowskiella sp. JEL0078]|nr:hypothetical protein HK096_003150 [Nowakowskiella sp. JEL0078]